MPPRASSRPGLPFRFKNQHGKETGSYYVRKGKREICLRTKDPDLANARAKLVKAGKAVDFAPDDGGGAARAIADAVAGTGGTQPPVVEPAAPASSALPAGGTPPPAEPFPPNYTAPPALPPSPPSAPPENAASASAGPIPVKPDAYMPPPPGWADQVSAAAGAPPPGPDATGPDIEPEFVEAMLQQAAAVVVELQLMAQAWIIKRRASLKASTVPDDAKGREVGQRLWVGCFRRLMPSDLPIPDWLAAPVLIAALTIPVQLQGAEPIKPDPTPGQAEGGDPAPGAL